METGSFSYASSDDPWAKRTLIQILESATGQRRLERMYLENRRQAVPGESFWTAAIRKLQVELQYDSATLERAPRSGPLAYVSNHPFGVLDGIALCSLVEKVRPDFRVLTNAVLLKAPEIRDYVLPIDFSGSPEARSTNARSRAEARRHLEDGGALVLFPAGAVSTSPDRFGMSPAIDGPWGVFAGRMIRSAKASVVPVHFSGQNSRLFQIASHVSEFARLALLLHEVRRRIGSPLPVRIGEPIGFAEFAELDPQALTLDLRRRSERLA